MRGDDIESVSGHLDSIEPVVQPTIFQGNGFFIFFPSLLGGYIMNKKIAALSIALAVTAGSTTVYAAALNTNMLEMIKTGVESIQAFYSAKTNSDIAQVKSNYSGQVGRIVDDATASAVSQVETNQKEQVARADRELNAYVNEMKQMINSQVNQEVQAANQQVNSKVDKAIEDAKKEIEKQFEEQLKKLKK
jgi:hypothetical protein